MKKLSVVPFWKYHKCRIRLKKGTGDMVYSTLTRKNVCGQITEEFYADEAYDTVGKGAFKNSIKVKRVYLSNIRKIETEAFWGCTSLLTVDMPKTSRIGKGAFAGCSNLRSAVFPEVFSLLGKGVFFKCKRLGKAVFQNNRNCKKIPSQSFAECRQLKVLLLPNQLASIGEQAFYKCEALEKIILPDSLKVVESKAFYQCGLKEIELPDGLEKIGDSAFLKCKKLKYVRIPSSVREIGKWAFHGCGELECLEITHDPEVIGEWITNKNCTIRCRKGSKAEVYAEKYGMKIILLP